MRLSGATRARWLPAARRRGKGSRRGRWIHAWVDEAVNPAVAHVNAWRLEADGNGGLNGAACYFPENGNDVNIYAMHGNFTDVIEEG